MLCVTACERDVCRLWMIDAVDESKADRAVRRAAERRVRDRERKRANRAEKGGSVTRDLYEAESLSRAKPWEAEGISRATWYRRNRETAPAACYNPAESPSGKG